MVIAAYNEEQRIGPVLDELLTQVANVVVVNDGSKDGTSEAVLQRPVYLLEHAVNLGQGAALQTGISFALIKGASHIATFDADGQHQVADLVAMYQTLEARHADFALGSRFLGHAEGIPVVRRLMLRMAILFTRLLSGVLLSDAHNGLRLMTRRGASRIHLTLNRMEHASQIIDQIVGSRLPFVEVPVTIRYTCDSLAKGQRTSNAVRLGVKLLLEKVRR
ncbi:MAG: glycosyltransferase family 2 protein [Thermoguttaceae bacterium]|nr:glycosyltransferase family 2 protein [Thermoguttaceae bacterium]